jgi:hypothetical protein
MATLIRDKVNGQFIGNTRTHAVEVACDVLNACLEAYKAGDRAEAIKLLNSDKLRPIAVVQAVQGRVLLPEESSQYIMYPCVDSHLKTAMHAGKEFEELKRACRARLHETADFTSKFARFVELLGNRSRTQ